MAQRLVTSNVNTNRPGAYPTVNVRTVPVGAAVSGNIVLLGEAEGGPATKAVDSANGTILKDTFFGPDQLDRIQDAYIAGNLVEGARAVANASSDTGITGSASRIYLAKTNISTKASAAVNTGYGTFTDKKGGVDGNKNKFKITATELEVGPATEGDTIAGFGVALDGATFSMRVNGGALVAVTLGTGGHANIADLVTELNGLLPVGIEAVEGEAADSLRIQAEVDATAHQKGFGKSFEIVETNAGDLALLGLEEGLFVSTAEPEVQIDISRQDTNLNEQFLAAAEIALNVGYEGTTATLTVTDTTFTTTVTGGSGANLSVALSQFVTLAELAAFIDAQPGYTASVETTSAQLSPVNLDNVAAIGICSTNAGLEAGRVKRANFNFKRAVGQSTALDFESTVALGLPDEMGDTFLAGGAKGATTAANVVNALKDLETIDVNIVLPLFSRDATADIADGLTDAASTYTIDAVHASAKNHVLAMSKAKIKKHRIAILSFWGTFAEAQQKASAMANARVSIAMQKTTQVDVAGNIVSFMPWHTAAIAAGMQAAGFYKSITNKFANVIAYEDPAGFDSGSPTDIETAIDAGLLFMEQGASGNKWVVDQTTYGVDTNFVFNSIQAMYTSDIVALDLARSFENAFVGQSLADVDASTALAFLASKMDSYKRQKLIAASDDAPLGFKNAKVSINGPIMEVSVEIKLATAILFIPINIEISQVQSAAE